MGGDMPVVNYQTGEINAKIVYYGPGLSGKTTNLEYIYSKMPRENKGKMISMKTKTDRTLFFDFLPIDIGEVNGMKVRFLIYTVPGQVYYNATRKLVLKGVDAVVFVADSDVARMEENKESLNNLEDNLNDLGLSLKEIPWVIQYNKRDLPNRLDSEAMERELNSMSVPSFEAVATKGDGVYETFEGIARLVFSRMREEFHDAKGTRPSENIERPKVDVEVVAQGASSKINSETGVESSLSNAEKKEEEHESVSEFVDNVLKESESVDEETIDIGATREGYENYGHLVELGDDEPTVEDSERENKKEMEIITDPLSKMTTEPEEVESESETVVKVEGKPKKEKTIRVPVDIPASEVKENVSVKILLEINFTDE